MTDTTIIRTEDLTKAYGKKVAVNHLGLEIRRGEIFGLLGPNGAGKTTTILMLLGLTEPTQGRALIDGYDCTRQSMQVKRITGYMPDNVGFYSDMTGRENLRFTARLNGIPEKEIDPLIDSLIEPEIRNLFERHAPETWYCRCPDQGSGGHYYG